MRPSDRLIEQVLRGRSPAQVLEAADPKVGDKVITGPKGGNQTLTIDSIYAPGGSHIKSVWGTKSDGKGFSYDFKELEPHPDKAHTWLVTRDLPKEHGRPLQGLEAKAAHLLKSARVGQQVEFSRRGHMYGGRTYVKLGPDKWGSVSPHTGKTDPSHPESDQEVLDYEFGTHPPDSVY